jgi:peptidoglycan/LPS O-acetylase OafA/YrhL
VLAGELYQGRMWRTDSLWFEAAIVLGIFAIGNILFGHFEQHNSPVRRLAKVAVFLGITLALSATFGRAWGLGWLLLPLGAALYIHLYWLPKHGVNGLTAEPRDKYLELVARRKRPLTEERRS